MNLILHRRCRCNEARGNKKRISNARSEGKPIPYPDFELNEGKLEIFQIKYEKKLSSVAKFILSSFQNKYIYYAIDDIRYLLKSNPIERENLLRILYSPVLSLQNNFSVNFFDIWIQEIYVNEVSKVNKFIGNDSKNLEQFSYITIKLLYQTRPPIKKRETLW